MKLLIAWSLLFLLLVLPVAAPGADHASSPAKRGPQAEEFYRLQGELNGVLAELAGLQVRYPNGRRGQAGRHQTAMG